MKRLHFASLIGIMLIGRAQAADNKLILYSQGPKIAASQRPTIAAHQEAPWTTQDLTPLTRYTRAHENRIFINQKTIASDLSYRKGFIQGGLCTLGTVSLLYGGQGIASFAHKKNYFRSLPLGGMCTTWASTILGLFNSASENHENKSYWDGWFMSSVSTFALCLLTDFIIPRAMDDMLRKLNN